EDGEWMQYSFQVNKDGKYNLSVELASDTTNASYSILVNSKPVVENVAITNTGGKEIWKESNPVVVTLKKGMNQLRFRVGKGGFQFRRIIMAK
ncbi:MAG: carbohydrate-binding protein, partial [Flavisolibacter sp.]